MLFVSSQGYVHRDLAARNVLITNDGTAKVCVCVCVVCVCLCVCMCAVCVCCVCCVCVSVEWFIVLFRILGHWEKR